VPCFAVTKQWVGAGRQWYFHRLAAKVKEQNLAVFGESGSGKTVLLSSFCGASQGSSFLAESLYEVLADDIGQGGRVRRAPLSPSNSTPAKCFDRRPGSV
jgi:GTPase SAR1 family protein